MIWLGVLIWALAFVVVFHAMGRLMTVTIGRRITRRHRWIEQILDRRRPVEDWLRRWQAKAATADPASQDQIAKHAQIHVLKRMDELIQYAKRSPLVEDEPSRAVLVSQLESIRAEWQRERLGFESG